MNKVELHGWVGDSPKDRRDGVVLKVATERPKGSTEWHLVICADACADVASRLRKGDRIEVVGHLRTMALSSPEGEITWVTHVACESIVVSLSASAAKAGKTAPYRGPNFE